MWPGHRSAHMLRWETTAMYDATALRNDLISALWRGGYISRELRQRSEGTSNSTQRGGYALESTLSYAWGGSFIGLETVRPRLSVSYRDLLGLRYSTDLYRATFFGNADHENDVMHLAPSAYEKVRYQVFGFGVEHKETGSYLMLHAVSGQDLGAAIIAEADLFTATDGRYLRLELDGDHSRSADDGSSGWRSRGIGAALSFRLNTPLHMGKHALDLSLGGEDLGEVYWNDRSLRVKRDTTILYDGIRVDDVLDLDGVLIDGDGLQDTLGLAYTRGGVLRPLPAKLFASLSYDAAFGMRYSAELDYRRLPGYRPHVVVGARHTYRQNAFRAEASFGGFGGWRAGLGAERILCQRLVLELRVPNVIGMVSENARGRAVMLSLGLYW